MKNALIQKIIRKLEGIIPLAWRDKDFRKYKRAATSYLALMTHTHTENKKNLLLVSLRGMNITWAQLWCVVSTALRTTGAKAYVILMREQSLHRLYYRLFRIKCLYFDDLEAESKIIEIPGEIAAFIKRSGSFADYQSFTWLGMPIGQIALSTYSRNLGTGLIDLGDSNVRTYVNDWIVRIWRANQIANQLFARYKIEYCFFTEVFMEEYGAFYYAALQGQLNVMRFAGTVRDNCFIIQHLNRENDRTHHASLSARTWAELRRTPLSAHEERQLDNNFRDRYGDKWYRSRRNQPNTQIMSPSECKKMLGVADNRKVAVVFSHILYDTLFFFGTDLFANYADWLVETTRAACKNAQIDWLIKVHPSNLWRGELNSLLRGKYEEERIIQEQVGQLPPHVRIVGADTRISPYSWFGMADYGITVRGTSGLEMAALGKTVITAGTGRYEGNGFTIDPRTREEYLNILAALPEAGSTTSYSRALARRYAHGIFVLKPFEFDFMQLEKRSGATEVKASDDLIYLPRKFGGSELPGNLGKFRDWALDPTNHDLLTNKSE